MFSRGWGRPARGCWLRSTDPPSRSRPLRPGCTGPTWAGKPSCKEKRRRLLHLIFTSMFILQKIKVIWRIRWRLLYVKNMWRLNEKKNLCIVNVSVFYVLDGWCTLHKKGILVDNQSRNVLSWQVFFHLLPDNFRGSNTWYEEQPEQFIIILSRAYIKTVINILFYIQPGRTALRFVHMQRNYVI